MRRKPDPDQRRRELCDAAIRLLADDGAKGLSHLKVDRKVGVPDGTTSFYFRTRSALLHAVAARIAEIDLKELSAAVETSRIPEGSNGGARPSGLATLVVRSATGARLTRSKARFELALQTTRDRVLEDAFRHYNEVFLAVIREAVLKLQPPGRNPAPTDVDDQAYVVTMFISGVMLAFASGDRKIRTAEELDLLISGIVAGFHAGSPARRADAARAAPARARSSTRQR